MAFAEIGDVRLYYTDDGSGESTLLLVHGWGADSHEWIHHIPALARDHRVIAVDLRGHGYSTAGPGNTPVEMTDDLVRLCASLDISGCVVVGHSMGAVIGSRLAVEHPSLVQALVVIDPGYGFPASIASMSLRMFREAGDPHAAAVQLDQWCYTAASPAWLREWHRRRLLATPPHVLAEAFEALWAGPDALGTRPDCDDYLARRECPVLTFHTDPRRTAWESGLFKHPSSQAVTWPGSGHRLHEERPAEFVLVLNHWLKEVSR
ncbi:alpha/beta fold hydrolase [Nonomuraea sp. NPDC050556]|uniref:alpha/beta fold hydrolase n=1 Tax=Nonomuraea sp. NPDC050556 TaxID=3364369 RepID=UPI0037941C9D